MYKIDASFLGKGGKKNNEARILTTDFWRMVTQCKK